MYIEVTLNHFREAFKTLNRDDFSSEGLEVLFNHLNKLEKAGFTIKFNMFEICHNWTEYSLDELIQEFWDNETEATDFEKVESILDYLRYDVETDVLEVPGKRYIVQKF